MVRWPLPSLQRQTPKWFGDTFGPVWGAFAWGADLGQGWTSHILFAGFHGLAAWALLRGSAAEGAFVIGAYGLGRALPLVWAGLYERRADLNAVMAARVSLQPRLLQLNGGALAFAAGFFLMGVMLGS